VNAAVWALHLKATDGRDNLRHNSVVDFAQSSAMLFKTLSAAVYGIDDEVDFSLVPVKKEVFHTVGLPDAAVPESRDWVRAAIKNSGYGIPPTIITINLAPVDMKRKAQGSTCPSPWGFLGPMVRCGSMM
jgi:hypothetical protein